MLAEVSGNFPAFSHSRVIDILNREIPDVRREHRKQNYSNTLDGKVSNRIWKIQRQTKLRTWLSAVRGFRSLLKRDKKQSVRQIKNGVASRVTSEHELACSGFTARPTLAELSYYRIFRVCTPASISIYTHIYMCKFSRAPLHTANALILFMLLIYISYIQWKMNSAKRG